MGKPRERVVALVSGGADGELAARMVEAQGVDVHRVHVDTGFVRPDRRRAVGLARSGAASASPGAAGVTVVDARRAYFRTVVARPRFGRGRAMEACLDCRAFLLRVALERAGEIGACAVVTGEVLGQHPWSQSRAALARIAEASGRKERIVRPLSARRLPPTAPEVAGTLDRERLLAIQGRARGAQRALAAELGIGDAAAQPGGRCCLLADPAIAARTRDLLAHRDPDRVTPLDVDRLRVGRHFRFSHAAKAIAARDAGEADDLAATAAPDEWIARAIDVVGTTVVVEASAGARDLECAAAVTARYGRARARDAVTVALARAGESLQMRVRPAPADRLAAWRIGPAAGGAGVGAPSDAVL